MNGKARVAVALAWAALLGVLGLAIGRHLEVSGDLRLFMPEPRTTDQRLLLGSLGEGPGSRLLLLGLSGGDEEDLAQISSALREALREAPAIRRVSNGEPDLDAIDPELLPYRYLLTDRFDGSALDAALLRAELKARRDDLGSPAGALFEDLLARDPTLETLRLAESWRPAHEPESRFGVWFTGPGEALLVAETAAAAFDPVGQAAAMAAITNALAEVDPQGHAALEATGPGAFSMRMRERVESEASRLSFAASAFMLALIYLAYRSFLLPWLAALPLATAAVGGLAAVALVYGSVHGITLSFGVTLVGVAMDYPVHVFSHRRADETPWDTAAHVWPTLAASVAGTCVAYAALLIAGVPGLEQLAVFTVAGLLVAAPATRWLLPALLPPGAGPTISPAWSQGALRLAALAYRPVVLLALACAAWLVVSPRPLWDDNLASLAPVPAEWLARDARLRAALGASDLRHVLVLEADSPDALLQRCETLLPALRAEVAAARLAGFEAPCSFLPSTSTQQRRQHALPDASTLRAALVEASHGLGFRAGAFEPFVADVEAARTAPPLTTETLRDTALGLRIAALLPKRADRPTALIGVTGRIDAAMLAAFAARQGTDVHAIDVKAASESLAAGYRERLLLALLAGLAGLLGALALALRNAARVFAVVVPVALTVVGVAGALHALGVGLNLFHLVALILVGGVGLDYSLFFERAGREPAERDRALHGVTLCAVATAATFGLLVTTTTPVLRAIGSTVLLGTLFNLVLAMGHTGGARRHGHA